LEGKGARGQVGADLKGKEGNSKEESAWLSRLRGQKVQVDFNQDDEEEEQE
jgi:hypothetical protein